MTQDEIMFMAMKSGCPKENALANMDILEAFAKLVAAKEREACAKRANVALLGTLQQTADRVLRAILAKGEA